MTTTTDKRVRHMDEAEAWTRVERMRQNLVGAGGQRRRDRRALEVVMGIARAQSDNEGRSP